MALSTRSRILYSLIILTVFLLGAAPPKEAAPEKKADPQEDKKDPTKPRYVKINDPKIIEYAESMYLNSQAVYSFGNCRQHYKQKEQAAQDELEAYKTTPNPEKAVIRYLEGKVQKVEKETKECLYYYERCKEDLAEYQKTKRIPTWIVEEYKRTMEPHVKKASRP